MHPFAGGAAAVRCDHSAVGRFIKFNAEIIQPLNRLRSIAHKLCKQFSFCGIVPAAERIDKMDGGRIVWLIRRLNTALCHHGIGIAHAQLCDNHGFRAGIVRLNCRGSTCAAAADDKHIHIICHIGEINILRLDTAVRLQKLTQLMRHLLTLVRADGKRCKFAPFVIGMVCGKQIILFLCGHTGRLKRDICFSCSLDRAQRRFKFF